MAMYKGRECLSISDAASRVGVSRSTLYNWLHLGKLETIKTVSGKTMIFVDSLWRRNDERQTPRA